MIVLIAGAVLGFSALISAANFARRNNTMWTVVMVLADIQSGLT